METMNDMAISVSTDCELLSHFAAERQEGAFSALVERHGGMVLGTCRRICGDSNAEDCAQAVFMIMAAKADQLMSHVSLPAWLHRTATNIALKQRASEQARRRREMEAGPMLSGKGEPVLREEMSHLDRSLQLLSDIDRIPLVLHYLQGKPVDELAQQLKISPESVAMRLSRGRERLRHCLRKQGIALSGAALLSVLLLSRAEAAADEFVAQTTAACVKFKSVAVAGSIAPELAKRYINGNRQTLKIGAFIFSGIVVIVLAIKIYSASDNSPASAASYPPLSPPSSTLDGMSLELDKVRPDANLALLRTSTYNYREVSFWGDADGHHLTKDPKQAVRILDSVMSLTISGSGPYSTDLKRIAAHLAEIRGVRIDVAIPDGTACHLPAFKLAQVTLRKIFDEMCRSNDLEWTTTDEGFLIRPRAGSERLQPSIPTSNN
jgi:RNA polymerase sigma factor (sigma-70 family)